MKNQVQTQWWVVRAIRDEISRVFAVTAGLGAGKTFGECQWIHDRVLSTKAKFCFFMMPTHQKIHDALLPTYEKVMAAYGLVNGRDYFITRSPIPKIQYRNGQEVHCLSGFRSQQLVATEYGAGVIDEAGSVEEEIYKLARTRIRAVANGQLLLGGVPQGLNYYADLFDDQGKSNWVETGPRDYVDEERRFRRFRLTTYENPFLPPDYVDTLLSIYGANSAYVQSYVYGIFTALCEGNCYTNFSPVKHVVTDQAASPARDLYWTLDFNASPLAWVTNQLVPFEEGFERKLRMLAIHNADMGGSTLEDAAVEFASKHPVAMFQNTQIKLYGDSSGHAESHKTRSTDYEALARHLRTLGYRRVEICALRHNPLETVSVEALNGWFLADYHYICKRCGKYIKSLMGTRWKDGEKKIDKPAGEQITHWGDAQKYLAYALKEDGSRRVASTSRY